MSDDTKPDRPLTFEDLERILRTALEHSAAKTAYLETTLTVLLRATLKVK